MNARALIILFTAGSMALAGNSFAKTASCPCSPCKCSPCTCGGGGGSKGGKHHDKEGHHEHGGGVGVGVNVDLGGVGRRSAEPDPFATGGSSVPRTQEKQKTTRKEHEPTTRGTFDEIKLTGVEGKGDLTPPGPVNVSDDTETPPTLPGGETFRTPTMDDLKNARDTFNTAEKKFLNGDPNYQAAFKQWKANTSAKQGSTQEKDMQKAWAKMMAIRDDFRKSGDGKKLFDDWMKAYQSVGNKPGVEVADELVPPDKLEQAKHNLVKAQNTVKTQREIYDEWKNDAVKNHNGVKNMQSAIDELKKKPHTSEKDAQADRDKLKQLEADLDSAKKQVAKDWASSDSANYQMKNVQEAEKNLEKAKADFKPYEGLDHNPAKAASNP